RGRPPPARPRAGRPDVNLGVAWTAGDGAGPTTPLAVPIPFRDPTSAFAPLAHLSWAVLLDSATEHPARGRFAYIAVDPIETILAPAGETADPFALLRAKLPLGLARALPGLPPFQGGALGIFGYELGRFLERLPKPRATVPAPPEMAVGLYDTIAAFDLARRQAWVIARDVPGAPMSRPPARARAEALAAKLRSAPGLGLPDWNVRGDWRAETDRASFEAMVARTVEYIRAGDIFQANMTRRFLAALPPALDPFTLYRRLRSLSPAPFAAYVNAPGIALLSASPERFLALDAESRIETRPIKGTRPRGANTAEDARYVAELRGSEKDRAENLMIVDLLRNDLSRVSAIGSVRVPELFTLETFANVHHLVSAVEGRLAPGMTAVDLLMAAFPGGSITGAPKIRAIEIIHELEPAPRGPYCGALAWIGFDGVMDSSIVIRTLWVADGMVVAQAGGGIVADSVPEAEYEETMVKAAPLLAALAGERSS
ncbi:MAG: aminodeoxychorismate synthase component I, partial [Pseudomonadota bacterium]